VEEVDPKQYYWFCRGYYTPETDILTYGAVYEDYLPRNQYFNVFIMMYFLTLSVAALPPSRGATFMQIAAYRFREIYNRGEIGVAYASTCTVEANVGGTCNWLDNCDDFKLQ